MSGQWRHGASMRRLASLFDPMVRLLVLATVLAIIAPAAGAMQATARDISSGAIFLLFFVNGLRVSRRDLASAMANWRFFGPLAVWVFPVMALLGLGFATLAAPVLPPLIALGFLYLGTLPSTVQSATSYTSLAGGNVALSVVGAALLTLLGVVATAPLFALLGGGGVVTQGLDPVMRIAMLLVLPFALGQAAQPWFRDWVLRHSGGVVWLDRFVIALAVYVAFSGAMEQDIGARVSLGAWVALIAIVLVYLAVATAGAWLAARTLAYPYADRIAFLFAGSQKSVAIGAPLAGLLFAPADAGFILAPLLLYHFLQLVLAAPLSARFAKGHVLG